MLPFVHCGVSVFLLSFTSDRKNFLWGRRSNAACPQQSSMEGQLVPALCPQEEG